MSISVETGISVELASPLSWHLRWAGISVELASPLSWHLRWAGISVELASPLSWHLRWAGISVELASTWTISVRPWQTTYTEMNEFFGAPVINLQYVRESSWTYCNFKNYFTLIIYFKVQFEIKFKSLVTRDGLNFSHSCLNFLSIPCHPYWIVIIKDYWHKYHWILDSTQWDSTPLTEVPNDKILNYQVPNASVVWSQL